MLYMNLGEGRMGTIDGRDVGLFAARVIDQPKRHAGKTYTPTGPESISMSDAAAALAEVLGKPVTYVALVRWQRRRLRPPLLRGLGRLHDRRLQAGRWTRAVLVQAVRD